jgi:hypothetical protein
VGETYLGSREEGVVGRGLQDKALIVVAAQAVGKGIGRIRMRVIQHPSAASIHPFVEDCIEPGSTVHTDGWHGYAGLEKKGYDHEVTPIRGRRKETHTLLPQGFDLISIMIRFADVVYVLGLKIFFCHAPADKGKVRLPYWRRRKDDHRSSLDEENLKPRQDSNDAFRRLSARRMRCCVFVEAFCDQGRLRSEGIGIALDIAQEKLESNFLIPVKLEECTQPQRLADLEWVNMTDPSGYQAVLDGLRLRASDLGRDNKAQRSQFGVMPPGPLQLKPGTIS